MGLVKEGIEMTYGQGSYTNKYDVYGYPTGKPAQYDWLGTVKDYNSIYAREQATETWRALGYTVKSVTRRSSGF